jgi:hypothetical protein
LVENHEMNHLSLISPWLDTNWQIQSESQKISWTKHILDICMALFLLLHAARCRPFLIPHMRFLLLISLLFPPWRFLWNSRWSRGGLEGMAMAALPMIDAATCKSWMLPNHRWATGRHSLMDTGPTRHAVPCGHAGLAFGPSTALWADFRAVLACKARRHLWAGQVHSLVHIKQLKKFISKPIFQIWTNIHWKSYQFSHIFHSTYQLSIFTTIWYYHSINYHSQITLNYHYYHSAKP